MSLLQFVVEESNVMPARPEGYALQGQPHLLAVGRTASFKQNDLAVAFILYVGHVGGFCTRVPFALCLSGVGEGKDVVEPTVEA